VRAEPRGRERRLAPLPPGLAALVVVRVVRALLVVLLQHGVVGGQQRGQVRGGQRAAGGAPAGPGRQHAPPLVEGVLGLGDLLGGRLRGGLAQARERLGLARVEIRQAPPATEPIRSVHRIQTRDRLKQRRKCIATTNQLLPGRF
jgi:hypothetical protein